MSHPKRKKELIFDETITEVSTPAPSMITPSLGQTNFMGSTKHYSDLISEAGKLGFSNTLGRVFNPTEYPSYYTNPEGISGIMAINVTPSVGGSRNINSGVNLATKAVYTAIMRYNNMKLPYDAADVTLLLLALDSILYLMAHIRRAFRIVGDYTWKNQYDSEAMLTAMGFIPSELSANLGNYITSLDIVAKKATALVYLREIPLLAEHAMLFSEIYKDSEDKRAQFYILRPAGYYSMEPLPASPKQTLVWNTLDNMYSMTGVGSMWIGIVSNLINKIAYINMYSNIAGQMEKAFGANITSLPTTGDLSQLIPVYDKSFGWLLENANVVRLKTTSLQVYESLDLDTNLGAVMFEPEYEVDPYSIKPVFTPTLYTTHDTLSADEVYMGTRWKVTRLQDNDTELDKFVVMGTDCITAIWLYQFTFSGTYAQIPTLSKWRLPSTWNIVTAPGLYTVSFDEAFTMMSHMSELMNYKWYPKMSLTGAQFDSTDFKYGGIVGNVDNYQKLDATMFAQLTDVRQMENFFIPEVTTIT